MFVTMHLIGRDLHLNMNGKKTVLKDAKEPVMYMIDVRNDYEEKGYKVTYYDFTHQGVLMVLVKKRLISDFTKIAIRNMIHQKKKKSVLDMVKEKFRRN